MRISTVMTWIVFILPLALGLFYVKHVVEKTETELAQLESQINADQDEIHVLKAEWIYLSRPDRVKKLASQYLDLQPTNSTQIADITSIPMVEGAKPAQTAKSDVFGDDEVDVASTR